MVDKIKKLSGLAFKFGALGVVGLLIGTVISIIGFQDFEANGFSFFNHTLSELGQYGHSSFAVVINGGLFFGSLSLILFCLFSIQFIDKKVLYPMFLLLVMTFVSLAATGLFPTNVYHLHTAALRFFFCFGCSSSALFIVYLLLKGELFYSRWNVVTSSLTLLSFMSFLLLSYVDIGVILPRPDVWWPATLEWISVTTFMLWVVGMLRSIRD